MLIDIETLETIELFAELNPEELEKIKAIPTLLTVAEAEVLMHKGEAAHAFFVILSGNFMISFDEDRAITLHNTGDIMGWSTVFTPFRYKGTAVALTAGEVLSFPGEAFLDLIQSHPALGEKIMRRINRIASERMSFVTEPESEDDF